MKKVTPFILILSLLVFASCKKNSITYQGGSWTFKSNTYNATSCVGSSSSASLVATGISSVGSFSMTFDFLNGFPSADTTYTVVYGHNTGSLPMGNYVMISAESISGGNNDIYYYSTGNGAPTIRATLASGKLSLSGTSIELVNAGAASDSTALTFNIVQTQ